MAKLTITLKDQILQEVELNRTITLGREIGDILIKHPAISARHLKIEKNGNNYTLYDLNSTNGTLVNDERVLTRELKSGDLIIVGRHVLWFENLDEVRKKDAFDLDFNTDADGGKKAVDAPQPSIRSADVTQRIAPLKEPAKLFLAQASGVPNVTKLDREFTKIGSADTSDIQIKGLTVGKIAAVIAKAGDQYEISYQGGFSRLKINGNIEDKRVLVNGDKFSIGPYNFEFQSAASRK